MIVRMRRNSNNGPLGSSTPSIALHANSASRCPLARWFGIGAFTFFLVKGLAWLVVPALLATSFFSCDVERDVAQPVHPTPTTQPTPTTESVPE